MFNAGDLEGSLNDYLPRLRVLNTQRDKITDHTHMEESWGEMFKSARPYLVSEIEEMEVNGDNIGDWAYILCRYAAVTLDKET